MGNQKNRGKGKGMMFILHAHSMDTNECINWPFYLMKNGYGQVGTTFGMMLAHRYSCMLAHGDPPRDKPQAAHSCGNKSCINKRHLSWRNQSENEDDKHAHGTWLTRISSAKLTNKQVLDMRADHANGAEYKELVIKYETPKSAIGKIIRRETWRHI
jgi:hypothetical protein